MMSMFLFYLTSVAVAKTNYSLVVTVVTKMSLRSLTTLASSRKRNFKVLSKKRYWFAWAKINVGLLIILGIVTLVLFVTLCNKFYNSFIDISREEKLKTINELISSKSSRQACKHPYLPVNAPEIDPFIKHVDRISCKEAPIEWVVVQGSECVITEDAKRIHTQISCTFTDILRETDFDLTDGESTVTNDRYTLVASDLVRVKCESTDGNKWHSVLIGIRDDSSIKTRASASGRSANVLPINVIFFGFDSLSRNALIRQLPKTYDYLVNRLQAVVLQDYNIVGDGTPQALIPILTGKNELELPDTRKRMSHAHYVNTYPFIWNDFRENGYVTAFLEDTPSTGIFTYRLKGFDEPPTDHYMRPYYLAADPIFRESPNWCAGRVPRHLVMMNFITQYYKKYRNLPKYLFGFHGELSHDDYNLISGADEDTHQWLMDLNKLGVFNDTIFVFMSDHGNRFAQVRNTLQGKQEERLPFFSFVVPKWFRQTHKQAYANLVKNSRRLATPFDIHATISHLLKWNDFGIGDTNQRSISLFKEIPKHRTCQDAFIEPHWCACLDWKNISTTSDVAPSVAAAVIDKINSYTDEQRDICAKLQLASVEWLGKHEPNNYLVLFHKNHDLDGYIADFKARPNMDDMSTRVLYQIKLITRPSDAIYEASVVHDMKLNTYAVKVDDISRVNLYGEQARCIYETYPNLRKFCYCID